MTLQSNDSLVKEIIFIDPTVEDYQSLLAGIYPDTKVVILDRMKDGVSQISENLQGGTYKAVHIVSHGSEGSLQLGSKQLNSSNLDNYKSQLQQWAKYLTDEADILLYGCDVAAGETGVGFVQQLSQLTGADVAASNDLTGSAALGGDWDLEVKTGKIEAPLAFQASVLQSYKGILPSSNIVISQIYGGGGNSGATYKNDFIELFNRGTTSVDISNWSVQYAPYNSNGVPSWQITNLSGSIASGSYYLIKLQAGTNGSGVDLPTANVEDTKVKLNTTIGQVALVNNKTGLTTSSFTGTKPTDANIIDFVGYGNTPNYYETSPTKSTNSTKSVVRTTKNPLDADNNLTDFFQITPTARNSSINGIPKLSVPASGLTYTENGDFALIDKTITVSDSDSANFNGGNLTVDFSSGANTDDILLILNGATNGVTLASNAIYIGGKLIGTFTGGLNRASLVVKFTTTNATAAAVQTLISNIVYKNISDNPLAGDRTVRFQLTDDTGLTSTPVTKTINLTAVNDAPIIGVSGASFQLYNGISTTTPDTQGFIYQALPYQPTNTTKIGNQLTTSISDYVGYAAKAELMPILDRNVGYSIKFGTEIVSEDHSSIGADKNGDGKADRAGFSVTVIGNDKKGIELGFWTNEIWAQNDGAAEPTSTDLTQTLFTHGEGTTISGFSTQISRNYELKVIGNTYSLFRDDYATAILTGNLRDYTKFATPAYLPSNPYQTPNFLFFGDGTPTSSANFKLGVISVNIGSTPGSISVNEDTNITVQGISINDVDSASITATLKANNGLLTVNTSGFTGLTTTNNGTGNVSLTGNINQINAALSATSGLVYRGNQDFYGSDTLTVTAYDGITTTVSSPIAININSVNDAPVVQADITITLNEDASNTPLNITAPTDVDGDTFTIAVTGLPDAIKGKVYLPDGVTQVNNNQILTAAELTGLVFRPVADANGSAGIFSYSANDGKVSTSQSVTFSINPVNDAPVVQADKTITLNEDASNTPLNITAPTDVDGDNLTITVTGLSDASKGKVYLADGTTQVNNNQILSAAQLTGLVFRPVADANGSASSFSYSANDGTVNSSQSITFTVNPVNDAPVVQANKSITLNEDASNTPLNITAPIDVDGDTLTIAVTGLPDAIKGKVYLADGTTQVNNNQILTAAQLTGLIFSPVADANGSAGIFSYSANDGTVNSSQSITFNINPVNDRPTFNIGANQSVKTGLTQTIAGWARDFNSGAANETQTVAGYIVNIVNNVNADIFETTPTINSAGNLTYSAKSGITASKTATIEVQVQDNGGTNYGGVDTSAVQTFKITVNPTTTNSIYGTPNPDNLMGTDQSDRISGLDNDDIIYGGLGSDRIFGDNGNDILYGDLGIISDNSDVPAAYGATFSMDDTIAGGLGNDKIYGNLGNDKLYGDEGDDQIWGGEGNDEIWGGYGNDTLYGGSGKDTFVLVRGQGSDMIMDFTTEDVLGCAGALKYSSLSFKAQNGDTLITDTGTNQLLATLKGFIGTASNGGQF